MPSRFHLAGRFYLLASLAVSVLLVSACAGEPIRATPTGSPIASPAAAALPTDSPSPATPARSPVAPAQSASTRPPAASPPDREGTAGSLAQAGREVFSQHCAVCHGDQGQGLVGPAVIGPRAALGKYGDGKGLLEYTSQLMPQNAPGSLSPEQYTQVTSYLLVQNQLLPPDAPVDAATLEALKLPP